MNDRFKFRAWDKNKKIMIYDAERTYDGLAGVEDWNAFVDVLNDDNYIVEQCTGLKDKNGKLIYEGDCLGGIFESCHIAWCPVCKSFQPFFTPVNECAACGGDVHWWDIVEDDGKLEVIGNIHENPELLEA